MVNVPIARPPMEPESTPEGRITMARSTNSPDIATLTAQVAALTEMVAALTGTVQAPTPEPKPRKTAAKSKPAKGAKVYTWKPWACAKFGIPSTVGMTFAYSGKNGTTDHRVIAVSADGIVSSVRA